MSTQQQPTGRSDATPTGLLRRSTRPTTILASLAVVATIPFAAPAADEAVAPTFVDSLATPHDTSDLRRDTSSEIELALGGDETAIIDRPGAHRLRGTLTDGGLVVDSDGDGTGWLILDGVDISNSSGAAIAIMDDDDAVVWLAAGSDNHLADAVESSRTLPTTSPTRRSTARTI